MGREIVGSVLLVFIVLVVVGASYFYVSSHTLTASRGQLIVKAVVPRSLADADPWSYQTIDYEYISATLEIQNSGTSPVFYRHGCMLLAINGQQAFPSTRNRMAATRWDLGGGLIGPGEKMYIPVSWTYRFPLGTEVGSAVMSLVPPCGDSQDLAQPNNSLQRTSLTGRR
jgi:hypothetical protein